ncbi:multidrug efflux SMR transporter [uncultured Vagococcus sp.]|uniref:DMT family transporter n=1 Tax=uncultured Vagococcus sp. TaxID=189676 RepID=UPI0028D580CC|nr:multidrug efflux SMR transporter [uncultured Vagococcus sp.]
MTKEWLKVLFASIFELVWVSGLGHAETLFQWVLTGAGVVISFILLTEAAKTLPIGTVYAVFAGIGSVGSIIVGVLFFGEDVSPLKLLFMVTLILGIIGLKLIETPVKEES